MKILVIKSSPHVSGTSNTLVKDFIRGATEKGHEIEIYDAAHGNLHPCLGCDHCYMNGPCIQKDDGNKLLDSILASDCLVLATPLYYFGVSAQLKTVIDRFYARTSAISRKHLKVIYIVTAWNDDEMVMSAVDKHLSVLTDYLNFRDVGRVLAKGATSPSSIRKEYHEQAYNLGYSL